MSSMQIVKALLVRNHPNIAQYIDKYFSAFSDPHIGRDAAKALGKLGTGGENVLIKANYAVRGVSACNNPHGLHLTVRSQLLPVQKFFNLVVPRILVGCQVSPGAHPWILL